MYLLRHSLSLSRHLSRRTTQIARIQRNNFRKLEISRSKRGGFFANLLNFVISKRAEFDNLNAKFADFVQKRGLNC
jgi:hypothetical protein